LITTLALTVALVPPLLAAPAGQLLDVQGRVEIKTGRRPARPAALLSELGLGDTLAVRSGRAELVLYRTGVRFALSPGSAVRIGPGGLQRLSGPQPQLLAAAPQLFARPLTTPRRPVPQKLLGVVTRGKDEEIGPRVPSPNGAIRQPAVTLRWEGPVEGERLLLQISDGERIVHRKELPLSARSYALPTGVVRPGAWYAWFVTATGAPEGPHKCYAFLRILTPEERAALDREEPLAAAVSADAPERPAAAMRLAQLYDRLGLFAEAIDRYQEVINLRPEDPGVRTALARLEDLQSK
jgi:hypothetical protein